jgi:hypothetical protein
MEIKVSENVIETVVNSLRASHKHLHQRLRNHTNPNEKEILEHQIKEVKEALAVFEKLI